MMRAIVVVACLLAAAPIARAQSSDRKAQAEAAATDAETRFQNADYDGAVERFKAAYALDPDPGYLFDIAQAYRLAGDCASSADYYDKFLDVIPDPPNAEKVKAWLAEQRACAESRAREEKEKPVVPPAPHVVAPPPAPRPAPVAPVAPVAPPPAQPSRTKHTLALGLSAAGVAALAVAGFFTWDGHELHANMEAVQHSCTMADQCPASTLDDYDSRGSRANAIAIAGYVAGGAAIASAAALYWLARSSAEAPIAVAPTRGGAMVVGAIRF
ncbi:MAG TPA: hypothetical protein VMJ10_28045 [Kofleriaceae bacterium]|nr:hypothetical protein [Kofleriaceae bacterium]